MRILWVFQSQFSRSMRLNGGTLTVTIAAAQGWIGRGPGYGAALQHFSQHVIGLSWRWRFSMRSMPMSLANLMEARKPHSAGTFELPMR